MKHNLTIRRGILLLLALFGVIIGGTIFFTARYARNTFVNGEYENAIEILTILGRQIEKNLNDNDKGISGDPFRFLQTAASVQKTQENFSFLIRDSQGIVLAPAFAAGKELPMTRVHWLTRDKGCCLAYVWEKECFVVFYPMPDRPLELVAVYDNDYMFEEVYHTLMLFAIVLSAIYLILVLLSWFWIIPALERTIDRKNKVPREVYEKELTELGLSAKQIATIDGLYSMPVEKAAALCPDSVGAQELLGLFGALKKLALDKYCVFDFGIIRGLDYYTGTVFEVFDNAPENNRAMFGGGRYDNLVGLFVKNAKVSGVGFGMGDVTLENFLVTHGLIPEGFGMGAKVLVTRFDDVDAETYFALSAKLSDAGIPNAVYLGSSKKFGKQIEYAVKAGFTHLLVMGATELAAGIVKIKDLAERTETEVPVGADFDCKELAEQLGQ